MTRMESAAMLRAGSQPADRASHSFFLGSDCGGDQLAKMERADLLQLAEELSLDGQRGWLTPDGQFFEADETPSFRIAGLELGGHERAALEWLEANQIDLFEELDRARIRKGFFCWEETDGSNLIKKFMFSRGFVRVADDLIFGS